MAGKKRGGLISKLVIGAEKSEQYARASLPSNRWELFWDILKGRFGKLVIVNLLTAVFFVPLIALIIMTNMSVAGYGSLCPYAEPFGVGYQAVTSFAGFKENIVLNMNVSMFALLPVAMIFAGLGISGGAYVIRNMVWTEGIFVANDFWRGIKQNFLSVVMICVFYSIILYATIISVSYENALIANGKGIKWLLITSQVFIFAVFAFVSIMTLHMISMVINYKVTVGQMIKNSLILTLGLLPQNILFAVIAFLPLAFLFFGGTWLAIGIILFVLLSISFCMLCWTNYCQWAYDKFMNDNVVGAKKNRGIYEKVKDGDSEALKKYKEQLALASASTLSQRPIKPITDEELKLAELPQSFKREDIEKLNESRKALYEDNERYIEEHKNDPQYKKAEESKLQAEAALKSEREKRIEQAKKELNKRNKKKAKR